MQCALEIDGKPLASIKVAAEATSYSRDYITRLAREEKIVASYIGRQWFVDVDSLRHYAESVVLEQEARKRLLSEERKRERQLHTVVKKQRLVPTRGARKIPVRSLVATVVVLGVGFITGSVAYEITPTQVLNGIASSISLGATWSSSLAPTADFMPAQTSGAAVTRTSFSEPTPRMAIATKESLGDVHSGVLLLPAAGQADNVASLFSDTVAVAESADGNHTVTVVDESGNAVGNPVPFVIVPTNSGDK